MTRFWLIRHGEPAVEASGICYGSRDFNLSPNGRAQIAGVAQYLASEPLAAIHASPLLRAAESARVIGATHPCPIEQVPDLREMNFGDFEGLSYDEIAVRFPDLYRQWMETPTQIRFPGGDSFADMRNRVLAAFHEIHREHEGQTVAIVSHGGINRILLAWALQIPDNCLFRMAQDYASINLLTITDQIPTVHLLNYRAPNRPNRSPELQAA